MQWFKIPSKIYIEQNSITYLRDMREIKRAFIVTDKSMDADMTERGLEKMGFDDVDVVFLENVGNLVCPAEFDVGAAKKVMILSVPEGDDKPLKYPLMFKVSDVMLMNGIPNFVLEKNVLEAEIDVLRQMGVEIKCGVEVGKDVTIKQLRQDGYKAFYLAIGLSGGRKANVPGEDAEGVESAVTFLNRTNQNHDEKMNGDVIVIGGGNVAVDVARVASRLTDGHVTMLCLEGEHEMPASDAEVTFAKNDGIKIKNGWGPKEILVENGKAAGVVFKKCTQVKDADGRFNPQYDESQTITVKGEHVLESIGQSALWGNLLEGEKVELRKNGGVIADPVTFQTAQSDIFAGGDIYHGFS